jgi:hypothetical protein
MRAGNAIEIADQARKEGVKDLRQSDGKVKAGIIARRNQAITNK